MSTRRKRTAHRIKPPSKEQTALEYVREEFLTRLQRRKFQLGAQQKLATSTSSYFDVLLRALCDCILQPERKSTVGRPPLDIQLAIAIAIKKVRSGSSTRQTVIAERESGARTLGQATISRFINEEALTGLLVCLIEESAKPLATIESGFDNRTVTMEAPVSRELFEKSVRRKHRDNRSTLVVELLVGNRTGVISSLRVANRRTSPLNESFARYLPASAGRTPAIISLNLVAEHIIRSETTFELARRRLKGPHELHGLVMTGRTERTHINEIYLNAIAHNLGLLAKAVATLEIGEYLDIDWTAPPPPETLRYVVAHSFKCANEQVSNAAACSCAKQMIVAN